MWDWIERFDARVNVADPGVLALAARVEAMASVIRDLPVPPHIQRRLDRLNIARAVRGTTGIEGTEFSVEEVHSILSPQPGSPARPVGLEEQEVLNSQALMLEVAERLGRDPHGPLTQDLIKGFHRTLTRDIDYPHNEPGRYRDHEVVVGSYLPPQTQEQVGRLMAALIDWINSGQAAEWNPVVRAVVAHFYLVSIHPFSDGNGRTARAAESYLLYQAGVNARGFYSLANYYYRHRAEYFDHLRRVQSRSSDDLTPFVMFALRGLSEELEAVHGEVLAEVRIISFRDHARQVLRSAGTLETPAGRRIIALLEGIETGDVSLAELRSRRHPLSRLYAGMTNRTLARDVGLLARLELLERDGDAIRPNLRIVDASAAKLLPGPGRPD